MAASGLRQRTAPAPDGDVEERRTLGNILDDASAAPEDRTWFRSLPTGIDIDYVD